MDGELNGHSYGDFILGTDFPILLECIRELLNVLVAPDTRSLS